MHPVAEHRAEVAELRAEIAAMKRELAALKPPKPVAPPTQFKDDCGILRWVGSGVPVLPPETKTYAERQLEEAKAAQAERDAEKAEMEAMAKAAGHPPGSFRDPCGIWRSRGGEPLGHVARAAADRARGEAALANDGFIPVPASLYR